jgi:hypothetical protein
LSDLVGNLISVIGILVSSGLGLTYYLKARRRRGLTYSVLSTRLLSMYPESGGRVRILFDEQPVQDVGLVFVTIRNSGNEPIRTADFEVPVRLSLSAAARIISADVTQTTPSYLPVTIQLDGPGALVVTPLLLNISDSLTIKLLITDFGVGDLTVSGRIVGIEKFRERKLKPSRWKYPLGVVLYTAGVSALLVYGSPGRPWPYLAATGLFLVALLLSLFH